MQVIVAGHTNRLVSNVQYLDLLVSLLTGFSLIIKLKEAGARRHLLQMNSYEDEDISSKGIYVYAPAPPHLVLLLCCLCLTTMVPV
jgi:hypothetical protein